MKRRFFIATSLLGMVGIGGFTINRWFFGRDENRELSRPKFLSLLCDQNTIRMLGCAYLRLKPNENKYEFLLSDLLKKKSMGHFLQKKDVSNIGSQIEKRIKQDFNTNNIVVVQGWVLSITEARQCAFFSIVSS